MNERGLRTCRVRAECGEIEYEGVFHGFFERADSKDGHYTRYARALVEDSFGVCRFVAPNRVEFTDGLAQRLLDERAAEYADEISGYDIVKEALDG